MARQGRHKQPGGAGDSVSKHIITGYQTGTGNRSTNDGTWTNTYDDQGNLTKKSKGASAETITYTYDNANRLLGMTDRATDGGSLLSQATYLYDALANRLEKNDAAGGTTTVTRFAYDDAGNAWADLNGSSSLTTRRVYLDSVDSEAARISGSALSFYLPDRLGSIRNQTDASGVLSNTITYDGFGKVTSETSSSNGDRFKFTGRELDSETGLQFHHARYYDPATGKWTTDDPEGFAAADPNLYRYVKNAPTNATDSTGLDEQSYPKPIPVPVLPPRLWGGNTGGGFGGGGGAGGPGFAPPPIPLRRAIHTEGTARPAAGRAARVLRITCLLPSRAPVSRYRPVRPPRQKTHGRRSKNA